MYMYTYMCNSNHRMNSLVYTTRRQERQQQQERQSYSLQRYRQRPILNRIVVVQRHKKSFLLSSYNNSNTAFSLLLTVLSLLFIIIGCCSATGYSITSAIFHSNPSTRCFSSRSCTTAAAIFRSPRKCCFTRPTKTAIKETLLFLRCGGGDSNANDWDDSNHQQQHNSANDSKLNHNNDSIPPDTYNNEEQQQNQPTSNVSPSISLTEPPATTQTTESSTTEVSKTVSPNKNDNNNMTNIKASTSTSTLSVGQKIRQAVFPIYGKNEVTKFVLIGFIKFFIILALTLTRDCKDTLVVTQSGAEAIAFLKIYGVLPAAAAYITMYSKLSDMVPTKQSLFYCTCIPFFIFFALFDWFIFPNAHILHPSIDTVQRYMNMIVPGSSGGGGMMILANIVSHWTSALFYVVAEIYSSVSVGLMFWQYANDVVSVDQAKRFYPLFAQMSGIAPIMAGQYVVNYASRAPNFQQSLHRLTNAVTFAGVMICYFYHTSRKFLERTEGTMDGNGSTNNKGGVPKKKKAKMTMMESAKFLAGSQYLRLVATLVVGYGLSINFTEIIWKSLVKKQYPDPLQYQRYMGQFSSIVGLSTCIVIFFGVHVIRILGWRIGAMATPGVMAAVSLPFFACILWPGGTSVDASPARLATAVIFGTLNSLLSKTAKYALFDPTTQMAYIPLDDESKVKGKAAIDVLGSRIGKSGGSLIQQGLVLLFGTILQASPAVCILYYIVLFTWMNAAHKLAGLFATQTEIQKAEAELNLQIEQQEQQHYQEQQQKDVESTPATATSPAEIKKVQ